VAAYGYAISDPRFEKQLIEKIGSIDRLRISDEQAEVTKAEQGVAPQSATRSESDSEGGDKSQPESEGRSR